MPSGSLRLRAIFFFGGFGLLASLILTGAVYFHLHDTGQRIMLDTLETETLHYLNQLQTQAAPTLPASATLRGYRVTTDPAIPAVLRKQAPGAHEVELDGAPYLVLVTDRPGMRLAFAISEAAQFARERHMLYGLSLAMLVLTGLSIVAGLRLTRRAVAPIIDLAARVAASELENSRPLRLDNLEDVSELNRIFQRYMERIRSCAERERAFASDVSHELRTPLAVIRGAVEVLEEDDQLAPSQRQRIARIERASQEMTELTSALLRLSREEGGLREDNENCSMASVVRESVEKHRSLKGAQTVNIDLNIVDAPLLPVEKGLATVVVDNLLGNAMLHAQSSQVQVCLERSRLVIIDSGKGIDQSDMMRLFQRHHRGQQSSGSGIGLSLVKRICDLHGWEISIDSTLGKGTSAELFFGKRPAV